ncbi:MAG: hypothetical protein AAGE01_03545, partial [Pseudomonadota bacterium]
MFLLLAGCAAAPTAEDKLSAGVGWVAAGEGWADEARAVFAEARTHVEAVAAERAAGSWAVVLD